MQQTQQSSKHAAAVCTQGRSRVKVAVAVAFPAPPVLVPSRVRAQSPDIMSDAISKDEVDGLIREAMAFKVKYRVVAEGRMRRQLLLSMLCVHAGNRGGQYPQPETVQNLGMNIFDNGFNDEEANHQGVCVQEVPEGARSRGYMTNAAFNRAKCLGSSLEGCFPPDAEALYGTLSHSHLLLVLLSWANRLAWKSPLDSHGLPRGKWSQVLDKNGRLDPAAVAAYDQGYEVLTKGLLFEVLSWKIVTEEPMACSKISQALNKGQALALKTTEIHALAVLNGTVGMELRERLASEVAFETVKAKVRGELDFCVDDPDFMELFEFVISLGADKNSYVKGLLDWASKFADPKSRQLRLSAYGAVNRLPIWAVRVKVALIQRAYRKDPQNLYCPNPEQFWGK